MRQIDHFSLIRHSLDRYFNMDYDYVLSYICSVADWNRFMPCYIEVGAQAAGNCSNQCQNITQGIVTNSLSNQNQNQNQGNQFGQSQGQNDFDVQRFLNGLMDSTCQ